MMVRLTREDAARNMARFYRLDVQPALFGWSVVSEWGRIGQGGAVRLRLYETQDEAEEALAQQLRKKEQRGYVKP